MGKYGFLKNLLFRGKRISGEVKNYTLEKKGQLKFLDGGKEEGGGAF